MREIDTEVIYTELKRLILESGTQIEDAAAEKLLAAEAKERGNAKFALKILNENIRIAREKKAAPCQDTGLAVVFLDIGQEVFLKGGYIGDAVNRAVADAYKEGGFRQSTAHPLTRENLGGNVPAVIHTEITRGDKIKLTFTAKGFGSENMSRVFMLNPSAGKEGITDAVLKTVADAGGKACPPLVIGVGIGGTMEKAALLSKRATLRKTGEVSPDADAAALETEILERVNALKIGVLGLGGQSTALAVHIETYPTHIAGLPVAVNLQCHAVRHKEVII